MAEVLFGKEIVNIKHLRKKVVIIQQTMEPGMMLSRMARLHGTQPCQLFKWKKQYLEGTLNAVAAGENVVPASELAAALSRLIRFSVYWARKPWKLKSPGKLWSTRNRENG